MGVSLGCSLSGFSVLGFSTSGFSSPVVLSGFSVFPVIEEIISPRLSTEQLHKRSEEISRIGKMNFMILHRYFVNYSL